MDDLDRGLLAALGRNARQSVAVLARDLDVARSTVQARLQRLERTGTIAGYTLRLGGAFAGARIRATVLLHIEARATANVLQRLQTVTQVVRAHTTSGRFDMTLEVVAATTAELDETLDRIGAIPGVRTSESLIQLATRIDRGG